MSYYPRSYFEDIVAGWFDLLGFSYIRNVRVGKYEVDFIVTHPATALNDRSSWGVVFVREGASIKAYGYDPLEGKLYKGERDEVYYRKFCTEGRKDAIKRILEGHRLNPEDYEEWLIVWSVHEDEIGFKPTFSDLGLGRALGTKVMHYSAPSVPQLKVMTLNIILYHILCYYRYGASCSNYKWVEPLTITHTIFDAIVYQLVTLRKENLLEDILLTLRKADNIAYKNELPDIDKPCVDIMPNIF